MSEAERSAEHIDAVDAAEAAGDHEDAGGQGGSRHERPKNGPDEHGHIDVQA